MYAPSSELVPPPPPPTPSLKVSVSAPLVPKGGSNTLAGEGVGDPIQTGQKAWHSLYSLASVVELKEKSPSRGRPEFGRLFLFKDAA